MNRVVNSQRPQTPTETAKAIANTISATTPKAPGALISFESATFHNNIVEMRFVVNDAAAFVRLKSSVEQMRLAKTSYYCNESRVAYLKQGVVMHEVIATSNTSDQIEFTFDKSSCAGVAIIVESRLAGGTANPLGIGFAVAALLSMTGGTILFKRFAPRADLVAGSGVQTLAGSLALAPLAFTFESVSDIVPTWRFVGAMAYVILCGSVAAYLLWFRLVTVYGTTAASAYHFLMPPFGMLFGWILLGEHVYAPDLLGVVPLEKLDLIWSQC